MMHTLASTDNWWLVDLQQSSVIQRITIYNRKDCCQERLNGAVIEILDEMMEVVVAETVTDAAPAIVELDLDDTIGRYVRVSLDTNLLHFNEVEVYGYPVV